MSRYERISSENRRFQVEGGIPHQPFFVSESVCELPFMWYKNLGGTFVRFVTIHAVTDGHLCDRKDRHACMQRGKNVAIAHALQREAARRCAVPLRFNFIASAKFEVS